MSADALPHASDVIRRASVALTAHGDPQLASELDNVHGATCDLVQAQHAYWEAGTTTAQVEAWRNYIAALARLRNGLTTGENS